MSATMRHIRQRVERIADRHEARSEKLKAVLRQQHDIGAAAEFFLDIGDRRVAQLLTGQILRGVEQRRRWWGNHCADVGSRPHCPLQAYGKRGRVDGRDDDAADLSGVHCLDIGDHPGAVVGGERDTILSPLSFAACAKP